MKFAPVAVLSLTLAAMQALPAAASVVQFYLKQDSVAGTWQLSACSSRGDNAGIASYSVPLIGAITSLDHKSPRAGAAENADGSLSGSVGFTLFRSADGTSPANLKVAGSQDNMAPTPFLIYGYGQTAGSWQTVSGGPVKPLGSNEGNNWLARPVIASGTMTPGTAVKINYASVNLGAFTFNATGSLQVTPATIFPSGWIEDQCGCPEPSTAVMAPIVVAAAAATRRSRLKNR